MTCAKEIDNQPFTTGMTAKDMMKMWEDVLGYPTLSSHYLEEAFSRASWFMEDKRLTREFLTADMQGKIIKQTR
jgi:hypothetical protein